MSAVGNFQMYIMTRMAQAEKEAAAGDQPTSETQVDPGVLHDDTAPVAYWGEND